MWHVILPETSNKEVLLKNSLDKLNGFAGNSLAMNLPPSFRSFLKYFPGHGPDLNLNRNLKQKIIANFLLISPRHFQRLPLAPKSTGANSKMQSKNKPANWAASAFRSIAGANTAMLPPTSFTSMMAKKAIKSVAKSAIILEPPDASGKEAAPNIFVRIVARRSPSGSNAPMKPFTNASATSVRIILLKKAD